MRLLGKKKREPSCPQPIQTGMCEPLCPGPSPGYKEITSHQQNARKTIVNQTSSTSSSVPLAPSSLHTCHDSMQVIEVEVHVFCFEGSKAKISSTFPFFYVVPCITYIGQLAVNVLFIYPNFNCWKESKSSDSIANTKVFFLSWTAFFWNAMKEFISLELANQTM